MPESLVVCQRSWTNLPSTHIVTYPLAGLKEVAPGLLRVIGTLCISAARELQTAPNLDGLEWSLEFLGLLDRPSQLHGTAIHRC